MGEYKGIKVQTDFDEITDEDVIRRININYMEDYAELEKITEGTLKEGDVANIDFAGYKDGELFEGGSSEGYNLELGSGSFIPGFEEGLIGKKIGSEVDIPLTFPDTYWDESMRSAEVVFKVKINHVEKTNYPELTPDDAKRISKGKFDNVADLIADAKAEMVADNEKQIEYQKSLLAWEPVTESSEVLDYPQKEINAYVKNAENFYKLKAKNEGISYGDYLEQNYEATQKEFRETLTFQAETSVKEELICFEIAKREGIELTNADITKATSSYLSKYGFTSVTELEMAYGKGCAKKWALMDKVIAFIVENAEFVPTPGK